MFFSVITTNLNLGILSGSNGIQAHNHLVCKQTLNHLVKPVKLV